MLIFYSIERFALVNIIIIKLSEYRFCLSVLLQRCQSFYIGNLVLSNGSSPLEIILNLLFITFVVATFDSRSVVILLSKIIIVFAWRTVILIFLTNLFDSSIDITIISPTFSSILEIAKWSIACLDLWTC